MRKIALSSVLLLAGLVATSGGCLAVAVGALAYDEANYKEERQAFNAQNLEREKAGLKPLTWDEWRKDGAASAKRPSGAE